MNFIYLSLILFLIGFSLWILGAILYKKSNLLEKKRRKKQLLRAEQLGTIAKVIFVIAAFSFVVGIMMLYGVKMEKQ